jgi:3-isopropylmalate/(R)-2-methylmalate dehydratase large subunit
VKELRGVTEGRVIEIGGPGVASLTMDQRLAIANGATHMGAATIVFPPDERLLDFVRPRARHPFIPVEPDEDARYVETIAFDLGDFQPLVSGPDNVRNIRELKEVLGIKVDAAYIGSCSSGRLEDLAAAAEVLNGQKVSNQTRLVVTPISSKVMEQASEQGLLTIFMRAGATVTTPGCGACFHGNQSPLQLDDGETCIASSVENYAGRMGSANAKIYLASAAVVAASAIAGRIASPSNVSREHEAGVV